jgi:Uma2 family endonuclease
LNSAVDDGTVVFMKVRDYLAGEEDMRRRELVWGMVREPPAARFGHQAIVTQISYLLTSHVQEQDVGVVCVSPADVVLDEELALVIQPDVFFISKARMAIIREQVWGAPDLVVEVASPGTTRYDRFTKVGWYRQYGVRECWLVDPRSRVVTVLNLQDKRENAERTYSGHERVVSSVLTTFDTAAAEFFRTMPA